MRPFPDVGRGRRRSRRVGTVAGLLVAAVVLAGCHLPTRLGVPTTVVTIKGTCDVEAVVEIGASLPLSGPLAAVGRAELTGLELAVDHINQSGGVLTSHRCLELLYKNDRSDPAVDDQALLDLVNQERVSLVVGPFLALSDHLDGAHLGSLGVTAVSFSPVEATFEPGPYPYTFPMTTSIAAQAEILAADAKRHHWQRVAVVSSGSVSSIEGIEAFRAAAAGTDVRVTTGPRPVTSRTAASTELAAMRSTHPDALVVFDDGSTLAPVLEVRHALHWSVPVIAASSATVAARPTPDLSGVAVVVPAALQVSHSIPAGLVAFRAEVLRALGRTDLPGALTSYAQAYDAIAMYAGAANGVNADDPGSLKTYLENANYQGILGSYNFTSGAHTGLDTSQDALVPLNALSNGLFIRTSSH